MSIPESDFDTERDAECVRLEQNRSPATEHAFNLGWQAAKAFVAKTYALSAGRPATTLPNGLAIPDCIEEEYRNRVARHIAKGVKSFGMALVMLCLSLPSQSQTFAPSPSPTAPVSVFAQSDKEASDEAWEGAGAITAALLLFHSHSHGGGDFSSPSPAPVPESSSALDLSLMLIALVGVFLWRKSPLRNGVNTEREKLKPEKSE